MDTWDALTIGRLGGIVSGLSATELGQLDLSDVDAVISVGKAGEWNAEKVGHLCSTQDREVDISMLYSTCQMEKAC